ncbi:unnamed protein product [Adineta steineri]|uniref:Aminoacyl-tRNA synthetase class II (D/K/N) domain-containing protein n=1 Tax=Adineta steineri TaxID=433720 RepID=A0A813NIN2_9BILA|nr:unnamed protein product [Adineta steineri]
MKQARSKKKQDLFHISVDTILFTGIYDSYLQRFILNDILHLPIEHLEHLLKALEYGAPPHGGIALGLDRLLALVLETEHIRDVIPFPKTSIGKDLMAHAPSQVEQSELDYYFLKIDKKN